MKTWLQYSMLLCFSLLATAASAHEGAGVVGGFSSGFLHPLLGWDHVAAMVAVGLWGAFLGLPAIWGLPVVFPLVLSAGSALAHSPIPGIGDFYNSALHPLFVPAHLLSWLWACCSGSDGRRTCLTPSAPFWAP